MKTKERKSGLNGRKNGLLPKLEAILREGYALQKEEDKMIDREWEEITLERWAKNVSKKR